MVAKSTPCTPFYEPGAPPPPLPLLTAQTDLLDNPFRPTTLINTEILPKSGLLRATRVAHHQRHVLSNNRHVSPLANTSTSEDSSGSDSSELSESDSDDSDGATIPKPPGEVGRPGRGGYTLDVALDWNPKAFKKLKVL
jgi:hypothetical protein